jgi:hypothetical protein
VGRLSNIFLICVFNQVSHAIFEDVYHPDKHWTLFALAGASVTFEKRGVLRSGATWNSVTRNALASHLVRILVSF